jgi:hypothetical protein
MKERSGHGTPKSSETDPPAANQPTGGEGMPEADDDRPTRDQHSPSAVDAEVPESPQVPPGKPDGEVDTRS